MPIFEFVCKKCHCEFEDVVFGDTIPACPHCHAEQTQKIMSCPSRTRGGQGGYDGDYGGDYAMDHASGPSAAGGGKCAGCSGGNCASCH